METTKNVPVFSAGWVSTQGLAFVGAVVEFKAWWSAEFGIKMPFIFEHKYTKVTDLPLLLKKC